MKKLKTSFFSKWARKGKITDEQLLTAAQELEKGLFSANLGGS